MESEQELLSRLQEGDEEAFRIFYDTNANIIYKYVLVRVGDSQTAEDITAEVFVKAWRAIPSLEWRGKPLRAWLFRIAYNQIVDTHRKKRDVLAWLPWRNNSEEDKAIKRVEDQDEIRELFATLSYQEQTILHLRFFEGYSLKEIAEFLEKSPNAVRVAQFRALKRLRHLMNHE